jgi:esterase/lipase
MKGVVVTKQDDRGLSSRRSIVSRTSVLLLPVLLTGCFVFGGPKPGEVENRPTWITPPHPVGAVVVIHGMNNTPESMAAFTEVLTRLDYAVLRVRLSGHDPQRGQRHGATRARWLEEVGGGFEQAKSRYPTGPIIGFGYSLGGALAVSWVDAGGVCDALVLIAPSLRLRPIVQLIRPLAWLSGVGLALPSMTPAKYRAFRFTSLDTYAAMFDTVDALDRLSRPDQVGAVPTLVLADPDDELVDVQRTEAWITEQRLSSWRFRSVRSNPLHHLILDSESAGRPAWLQILFHVKEVLARAVRAPEST